MKGRVDERSHIFLLNAQKKTRPNRRTLEFTSQWKLGRGCSSRGKKKLGFFNFQFISVRLNAKCLVFKQPIHPARLLVANQCTVLERVTTNHVSMLSFLIGQCKQEVYGWVKAKAICNAPPWFLFSFFKTASDDTEYRADHSTPENNRECIFWANYSLEQSEKTTCCCANGIRAKTEEFGNIRRLHPFWTLTPRFKNQTIILCIDLVMPDILVQRSCVPKQHLCIL